MQQKLYSNIIILITTTVYNYRINVLKKDAPSDDRNKHYPQQKMFGWLWFKKFYDKL